jgi:hypothetical protein
LATYLAFACDFAHAVGSGDRARVGSADKFTQSAQA